jgi:phosphatidate phosphatase APP1
LQFVLIGDNSEQDPEIYRTIVTEYPERIRTIYIRQASDKFENDYDGEKLINEVNLSGSQLIFAPDSEFAANHAAAENLIAVESLSLIRQNKKRDKDSPKTEDITEKISSTNRHKFIGLSYKKFTFYRERVPS